METTTITTTAELDWVSAVQAILGEGLEDPGDVDYHDHEAELLENLRRMVREWRQIEARERRGRSEMLKIAASMVRAVGPDDAPDDIIYREPIVHLAMRLKGAADANALNNQPEQPPSSDLAARLERSCVCGWLRDNGEAALAEVIERGGHRATPPARHEHAPVHSRHAEDRACARCGAEPVITGVAFDGAYLSFCCWVCAIAWGRDVAEPAPVRSEHSESTKNWPSIAASVASMLQIALRDPSPHRATQEALDCLEFHLKEERGRPGQESQPEKEPKP